MKTNKLILDACCGPRMMWFDKRNPQAVFMDIRDEEHILCDGRSLDCLLYTSDAADEL